MSSATHCHAFVATMLETIDFLAGKFPKETEIKITRAKVKSAAAINPRLVVTRFVTEVLPFMDELTQRNAHFFLDLADSDYDHVLGHLQIAQKWDTFTEDERNYLWDNINKMIQLGTLVVRP